MIVNIDRLVVMTIRGSFWRKVSGAVPRLVLAAFVAVVIARPLELWIFASEVSKQISQEERKAAADRLLSARQSARDVFDTGVASWRTTLGVGGLDTAAVSSEQRLAECRIEQEHLQGEWLRELNEGAGGRRPGIGPALRRKEQMFNQKRTDCDTMKERAESARQSAATARGQLRASIEGPEGIRDTALIRADREYEKEIDALNKPRAASLLERERALAALSSAEPDVGRMVLVITLLFLLVEILPVIAKLMAGSTVYDSALSQRERMAMAITDVSFAAETELKEAGEFSARLHAQLLRQRAAFRRRAIALQRIAVRDVLDQARTQWAAPATVVDAMKDAMTQAAHEAVTVSSGVVAGEPPAPEGSMQPHSPPSAPRVQVRQYFTGRVPAVSVFLASLLAVVATVVILRKFDTPFKNDLGIAVAVGSLVAAILALGFAPSGERLSHDAEGGRA